MSSDTLAQRFVPWVSFANGRGFEPTPVNVIVGPNGAGKSLMLRELNSLLTTDASSRGSFHQLRGRARPELQLLSGILRRLPPTPEAREAWMRDRGYRILGTPGIFGLPTFSRPPRDKDLLKKDPRPVQISARRTDLSDVGLGLTTFVHGLDRFSVIGGSSYTPADTAPEDCWSFIMWQGEFKKFLQDVIAADLGFNLYFDVATKPGVLQPRCSVEGLPDDADELSVARPLVDYYKKQRLLSEMSDGTQAYVTLMLAASTGNGRMLLLDEPEAFLHPPLARTAGQRLSEAAQASGHTVFASTHSSHFLMGCLDSGVDVTVIRLSFDGETPSATRLDPATLRALYRDPLLRSSRVLQGIFHDAVVVGEGEGDRAFYEEINRRLVDAGDADCSASTMFVCGQGKDTLWRIMDPLRRLGIPTAAIVDLDILKDQGMKRLMDAAGFPSVASKQQGQIRKMLKDLLWGTDESQPHKPSDLSAKHRAELRELLDSCAAYGVFIVPGGPLESWLADLGVSVPKGRWVATTFDRMGFDPAAENYLKPADGDVWEFMRRVGRWLADPDRKGMAELDGLDAEPTQAG